MGSHWSHPGSGKCVVLVERRKLMRASDGSRGLGRAVYFSRHCEEFRRYKTTGSGLKGLPTRTTVCLKWPETQADRVLKSHNMAFRPRSARCLPSPATADRGRSLAPATGSTVGLGHRARTIRRRTSSDHVRSPSSPQHDCTDRRPGGPGAGPSLPSRGRLHTGIHPRFGRKPPPRDDATGRPEPSGPPSRRSKPASC